MDRIKEFLAIVEFSNIPQNPFHKPIFYSEVRDLEMSIEKILEQLSKLTSYESFKSKTLLNRCFELLEEYKNIRLNEEQNKDYHEMIQNMKSMIKTRYLKYTLRLNQFTRKLNSAEPRNTKIIEDSPLSNTVEPHQRQKQEMYFQVPLIEENKEDFVQERRRIVNSITEIGQIVEDIAIHVNLQEEQLRRIDDVLIKTDDWNKKALNELGDIWQIMRSNRFFMIKFFVFWLVVILLFWYLRRL